MKWFLRSIPSKAKSQCLKKNIIVPTYSYHFKTKNAFEMKDLAQIVKKMQEIKVQSRCELFQLFKKHLIVRSQKALPVIKW